MNRREFVVKGTATVLASCMVGKAAQVLAGSRKDILAGIRSVPPVMTVAFPGRLSVTVIDQACLVLEKSGLEPHSLFASKEVLEGCPGFWGIRIRELCSYAGSPVRSKGAMSSGKAVMSFRYTVQDGHGGTRSSDRSLWISRNDAVPENVIVVASSRAFGARETNWGSVAKIVLGKGRA